jgi:hypothetical protein
MSSSKSSQWFTAKNIEKIKGKRTENDIVITLNHLKKEKKIKDIVMVTEEMMGRDTVNKCR